MIRSTLSMAFALALVMGSAQAETIVNKPVKSEPVVYALQEGGAPKEKDPAADYDKIVSGMIKIGGPIPLYISKGSEVWTELSEKDLGKMFYLQCTVEKGIDGRILQAGSPVPDNAVDPYIWQKSLDGQNIILVRPQLVYRPDQTGPIKTSVDRTFAPSILDSFKIEHSNPVSKKMLINVTDIFNGDLNAIAEIKQFIIGGAGAQYQLDKSNTKYEVEAFPENSVVRTSMHFIRMGGGRNEFFEKNVPLTVEDQRSVTLGLTYSLWYPKPSDYVPRKFDDRVGYFTQDFYDFKNFFKRDRTEKYILRWNLKKKDPAAAVSEPVKPITWVLDTSIPKEYRPAFRDAVLMWNKAFDKIGYKNAVQVKDAEEIPGYHHADGRFNVIRWVTSPDTGYAIALFRQDPFTGEILNASVNFDGNFVMYFLQDYNRMHEMFAKHPSFLDLKKAMANPLEKAEDLRMSDTQKEYEKMLTDLHLSSKSALSCGYASYMEQEMGTNWAALMASGNFKDTKEEFVRKNLTSVIVHEIGHCMGLRHNFAASGFLTCDQLNDPAVTKAEGISASVMDYTPMNIMAAVKGEGSYVAETIGRYDEWAIAYGYSELGEKTPDDAKSKLDKIAAQSGKPGLRYMTDEDVESDPTAVRFDLAKDQVNFWKAKMAFQNNMLNNLTRSTPKPGEPYSEWTDKLLSAGIWKYLTADDGVDILGGIQRFRSHYGDENSPTTPMEPVTAAEQKEYVSMVAAEVLCDDPIKIPARQAALLMRDSEGENRQPFIMRDLKTIVQVRTVKSLFDPKTLIQMGKNTYLNKQLGKPTYTINDHLDFVLGKIYTPETIDKSVDENRRTLQNFTVNYLVALASQGGLVGLNGEQIGLVEEHMVQLSKRFDKQLAGSKNLDAENRANARACSKALHEYFNAQPVKPVGM